VTDTDTPTAAAPAVDDTPIMHLSGAIQFHLGPDLVTLPCPKIGQLRRLRDAHHAANDRVRETHAEFETQRQAILDELSQMQQRLTSADTDDDGIAAAADAKEKLVGLQLRLEALTRDATRKAQDVGFDAAVGWFRLALDVLSSIRVADPAPGEDVPDGVLAVDDLPGWMSQLGTARKFMEHWMTHPSPRGI